MRAAIVALAACGSSPGAHVDAAGADSATDAASADAPAMSALGMVTGVTDLPACPSGAPAMATCKQITVTGCPGIETEAIDATIAITMPSATLAGTIVHFSGGGGEGVQTSGALQYANAGFRQVFVAWKTDWEQTQSLGIKAAGCRPATVLQWVFSDPSLHAASRALAFCGEGFSGGSGQLGYALAHYGVADYLDYVNELSGPPFARIDLGCDGTAPATATVCGATDTMRLPASLDSWENIKAPNSCGGTANDAAEIARWKADSIAVGGAYAYPNTQVHFFDCTNNATAVTAMAQIYEGEIMTAEGGGAGVTYTCFSQTDGCTGESLGQGAPQAVSAMLSGCVPRHQ